MGSVTKNKASAKRAFVQNVQKSVPMGADVAGLTIERDGTVSVQRAEPVTLTDAVDISAHLVDLRAELLYAIGELARLREVLPRSGDVQSRVIAYDAAEALRVRLHKAEHAEKQLSYELRQYVAEV